MQQVTEQKRTRTIVELVSGSQHPLMLSDREIYDLGQAIAHGTMFILDRPNGRAFFPGDKVALMTHEFTDMRDGSVSG